MINCCVARKKAREECERKELQGGAMDVDPGESSAGEYRSSLRSFPGQRCVVVFLSKSRGGKRARCRRNN